jgi:hypothetical protein
MPLSSDHLATKHCGPIGWFSTKTIPLISIHFVLGNADILINLWFEAKKIKIV